MEFRPRFTTKNIFYIGMGFFFSFPLWTSGFLFRPHPAKELLLIALAPIALFASAYSFLIWKSIRYKTNSNGLEIEAAVPFQGETGRGKGKRVLKNISIPWKDIIKIEFESGARPIYKGDGTLVIQTKTGLYMPPFADAIDLPAFVQVCIRHLPKSVVRQGARQLLTPNGDKFSSSVLQNQLPKMNIKKLRQLLKEAPNDIKIQQALFQNMVQNEACFNKKDGAEAIQLGEKLLGAFGEKIEVIKDLGNMYVWAMDQPLKAAEYYERCLALDPQYHLACKKLIGAYCLAKDVPKAKEAFQKARGHECLTAADKKLFEDYIASGGKKVKWSIQGEINISVSDDWPS